MSKAKALDEIKRIKEIFNGFENGTEAVCPSEPSKDVPVEDEKTARKYIEKWILPSTEVVLREAKAPVRPRAKFSMEPSGTTCEFVCGVIDEFGELNKEFPFAQHTFSNAKMSYLSALKKIASEYGLYHFEDVLNDAEYKLFVGIDFG